MSEAIVHMIRDEPPLNEQELAQIHAYWRACNYLASGMIYLKEKGNINMPLELAINNEIDRFSLAIDVINRVPRLQVTGAHVKEKLREMQIQCRSYAYENGVDIAEINHWQWLH